MNLSGTPFRKLNGVSLKIIHSAFFPIYSISKPTIMRKLQILILCAFVLSCKSTKTVTSSNESERDAVSQVQWRHAQSHSFSSLMRLTALSFDSCEIIFSGAESSATTEDSTLSFPSAHPQGYPSVAFHGKPSNSLHGKPSSFRIYGLHLSKSEKEKSESSLKEEDSTALAAQSSADKSQVVTKTKSSIPFMAKSAIAIILIIMAVTITSAFRRRRCP